MNKYFASTIAGGLVMWLVFMLCGVIVVQFFGPDVYSESPFIDYSQRMGVFMLGVGVIKLVHAFLLSYLHEKIPYCGSSLWTKTWRFALFSFFLVDGVGLLMTFFFFDFNPLLVASWATNSLIQVFAGSAVIISVLYRYVDLSKIGARG